MTSWLRGRQPGGSESIDPDVDLADVAQRSELVGSTVVLLAVIAVGGVIGAEARAVLSRFGSSAGAFPTSTLVVNVVGSALIGVLMTWIVRRGAHLLLRPFLGVGVLGGFTTFSAYAVQARELAGDGRPMLALVAVVATPALALAAVWMGASVTESLLPKPGNGGVAAVAPGAAP